MNDKKYETKEKDTTGKRGKQRNTRGWGSGRKWVSLQMNLDSDLDEYRLDF